MNGKFCWMLEINKAIFPIVSIFFIDLISPNILEKFSNII